LLQPKSKLATRFSRAIGKSQTLSDDLLCAIVRHEISQPICRNHGYVLDGFPQTVSQARLVFAKAEDEDNENGEEIDENSDEESEAAETEPATPKSPAGDRPGFDDSAEGYMADADLLPSFAVCLDAPDNVLKQRAMTTHIEEDEFMQLLKGYRLCSSGAVAITLLDFLDEQDTVIKHVDATLPFDSAVKVFVFNAIIPFHLIITGSDCIIWTSAQLRPIS